MRGKRCLLTLMAGAFLFASAMFLLMAAPGFLSDLVSTVLIITIVVIAWAAIAILLLMFIKRATDSDPND